MTPVEIVQVDERDGSWEDSRPRFRVYLHTSGESKTYGGTDTYDVTGADLLQVVDWAQRQAGDTMTYAVALVRDDATREQRNPGHGRGLVWLVGMDGNDTCRDAAEESTQHRMLTWRRDPVGVPLADRMPEDVPRPYEDGTEQR